MTDLLEFFEQRDWVTWGLRILLFYAATIVFVLPVAYALSRVSLIVKKDAELKVWFGWQMTLCLCSIMLLVFTVFLAFHLKEMDIDLTRTVPWLLYFCAVFLVAMGLTAKIQTKLTELRSGKK